MAEEEKKFLAKAYLECVDEYSRKNIFHIPQNNGYGEELTYENLKNDIVDPNIMYGKILENFKTITSAKMVMMFQSCNGEEINENTTYDEIVLLGESESKKISMRETQEESRPIPILKSELLKFFRDSEPNSNECDAILNLDDEVKIVRVAGRQSDKTVLNYNRTPCLISFVKINVNIERAIFKGDKKFVLIYFAIFYDENEPVKNVLKYTRNFIMFRSDFLARLEKDFENNLYGFQQEEEWRNKRLSIEKAGTHTSKTYLDIIINKSDFLKEWRDIFVRPEENRADGEDKDMLIKLIANAEIARLFRLIFSRKDKDSTAVCYEAVDVENNDMIRPFGNLKIGETKIYDKNNEKTIVLSVDASVANASLFYCKSDPIFSGTGNSIAKTYKLNYLFSFFVDVFRNAFANGSKIKLTTEYLSESDVGYLVITNNIEKENVENYELKQAIEFESARGREPREGFSLGCLNIFLNGAFAKRKKPRVLIYFSKQEGKNSYEYILKMPILLKEEKNENSNN